MYCSSYKKCLISAANTDIRHLISISQLYHSSTANFTKAALIFIHLSQFRRLIRCNQSIQDFLNIPVHDLIQLI